MSSTILLNVDTVTTKLGKPRHGWQEPARTEDVVTHAEFCKQQQPSLSAEEIQPVVAINDGLSGFPLPRNFYVRTDVNFNWLYVRKLK